MSDIEKHFIEGTIAQALGVLVCDGCGAFVDRRIYCRKCDRLLCSECYGKITESACKKCNEPIEYND